MWKRAAVVGVVVAIWVVGMVALVASNIAREKGWRVGVSAPDEMTGRLIRYARRNAERGRNSVAVICATGRAPQLQIAAIEGIPDRSSASVLMRIDDEEAQNRAATYSSDAIDIVLDSVMVGKLSGAKRLAVRYDVLVDDTVTSAFPVDDFWGAYLHVAQEPCGTVATP
jgi:hypothetical protein